jgi:hypothetical protein
MGVAEANHPNGTLLVRSSPFYSMASVLFAPCLIYLRGRPARRAARRAREAAAAAAASASQTEAASRPLTRSRRCEKNLEGLPTVHHAREPSLPWIAVMPSAASLPARESPAGRRGTCRRRGGGTDRAHRVVGEEGRAHPPRPPRRHPARCRGRARRACLARGPAVGAICAQSASSTPPARRRAAAVGGADNPDRRGRPAARQAVRHHHRAGDAALAGPAGIGSVPSGVSASSRTTPWPCTCFRNTGRPAALRP